MSTIELWLLLRGLWFGLIEVFKLLFHYTCSFYGGLHDRSGCILESLLSRSAHNRQISPP